MKQVRLYLTVVACLVLGVPALSQGLYFESQGSSGGMEKFWYMPGKFKSVDSDGKITIMRLDKEMIYQVDPGNHSYTQATFTEMKNMVDAGRTKMDAMMKKRLESMSPEQRKMLEEKMAGFQKGLNADVKYEVTGTGESKSISGYSCSKYIVKRNGKEFETIWATKALGNVESIHKDMETLSEKMASVVNAKSAPLAWFKDIPGFPIQNEEHGNTRTVLHVERHAVSESEFEVPAGYTLEKRKGLEELEQ